MIKYRVSIIILSVFVVSLLGIGIFAFVKYEDVIHKNIEYENTIEERNEEIADYEKQQNDLENEIESLENSVKSHKAEAESYSDLADEYATEISELESKTESLNSEIETLNSEIETLNQEIDDLDSQVAHLSDANYGIKANGRLQVIGKNLCNQKGEPIQLKGMSTHGISWYPRYTNASAIKTLKGYGANLIRLAVYSYQNDSYLYEKEENLNYLYGAIENALSQNMYVIVDWHVLQDETPQKYKENAKEFFAQISSHYGNEAGIIYEICNEPNGATTWDEVVSYANEIIPIIRSNAPDSVIIVGTPDFSFDIEDVLKRPLNYKNIMYTFHNYVDVTYRNTDDMNWMEKKLQLNIPVFVTEWGINDNGTGAMHEERAMKFVQMMKKNNISWCMWSLSNKNEVYSMLKPNCNKYSNWNENDFTFSGKIALKALCN